MNQDFVQPGRHTLIWQYIAMFRTYVKNIADRDKPIYLPQTNQYLAEVCQGLFVSNYVLQECAFQQGFRI